MGGDEALEPVEHGGQDRVECGLGVDAPCDTVERLTGRGARTFRTWARENAAAFA